MQNTTQFKVDFIGDETKTQWRGHFTARVKISHMDTLRQDEIRRTILGANGAEASEAARNLAHAYAFCQVRLVAGKDTIPPWFRDSNYGLDHEDGNMLIEVNNACFKAIEDARKEVVGDAEKALKELRDKLPLPLPGSPAPGAE